MTLELEDLLDYKDRMAHKWDWIGIKLGQSNYVKEIRDTPMSSQEKLTRIFEKWIEAPPRNLPVEWCTIVTVLKSKSVKLTALAAEIEKEWVLSRPQKRAQSLREVSKPLSEGHSCPPGGPTSLQQPSGGLILSQTLEGKTNIETDVSIDGNQPSLTSQTQELGDGDVKTDVEDQSSLVSPIQEQGTPYYRSEMRGGPQSHVKPNQVSSGPTSLPQQQNCDGQMSSIPGASELQLNPTHGGISETPPNTSLEPRQPATATPVHLPPEPVSFTPRHPSSSIPNPIKDDVLKARSHYLELLYQLRTNERRHGLEAHQGQDYGQDCIPMNELSEFGKSVFRIVIERERTRFGSGCFVTMNGYSWILTCCHNFVADRNDGELLKEGKGQEVVDLRDKMKEVMVISSLVFADDTFHLPEDRGLRMPLTDFVPDVNDCLVYPEKDILAISCAIPEEYQLSAFEMDFGKHNDHVPRSGDFLYVVQNPRNIPDDEKDIPPNLHVQCSVGMLWETEDPISYDALTYKGSSGSPILFVSSQGPILIGVHRKGGVVCNHGSLLPKELILAMSGMEKHPL